MNKLCSICFFFFLFGFFQIEVNAESDCYNKNTGSICYFDSFYEHPEDELYFHCDVSYSLGVKMTNHHVLISGFLSGDNVGAGTYTYVGPNVKKFFNTYYFVVKNDPKRLHGAKYVYMVSMGDIHCRIGTGGRSRVLPGLFGYVS